MNGGGRTDTDRLALRCLTCGSALNDPGAGSCHECGAEDGWIGSQWLTMPPEFLPLAAARAETPGLNVDRLREAVGILQEPAEHRVSHDWTAGYLAALDNLVDALASKP